MSRPELVLASACHVLDLLVDVADAVRHHAANSGVGVHAADGLPASAQTADNARGTGPEVDGNLLTMGGGVAMQD